MWPFCPRNLKGLFYLRVYPDAPRLEPCITENGALEGEEDGEEEEEEDNSDRESGDQDENGPPLTKRKRVVLKRNFRRSSREFHEQSDPNTE